MDIAARKPRQFLSAFTTVLFLAFLIAVHHFSITYVNSSLLGQFFSPERVSAIYVAASIIGILILAVAPRVLAKNGVWFVLILAIPLLQVSVFILGFTKSAVLAAVFFIAQWGLIYILRYIMDLYLESLGRDESTTGNTRGLFNTAGNIGVFLGPLIASVAIIGSAFGPLYATSALILTPVFFIALTSLRTITPHIPERENVIANIHNVWQCRKSIRNTMAASFLMHLFNTAIVIYGPLYLFETGGFSWQVIGTLTAFALLPYLIIEIPLGFLADRVTGEKEFMVAGLLIMGAAMAMLSIVPLSLFAVWAAFFVATRIGGAMVEITTESYFFKQVNEEDASLISAFRMLAPLGGIAAPLVALLALPFVPFSSLFAIFGAIFLLGIPFALRIVDTR